MVGNRVPREGVVARRWIDMFVHSNNPPLMWTLHLPGQPNHDLCVFYNKPHNQAQKIVVYNDPEITKVTSIPKGSVSLYICQEAVKYLKAVYDIEKEFSGSYNLDGELHDTHDPVGDNNLVPMINFTNLHHYVSTGTIGNLSSFLRGATNHGKCFLCLGDPDIFDSNSRKIPVPVGTTLGTNQVIYGDLDCCASCGSSIDLLIEEMDRNQTKYHSYVYEDICGSCKRVHPITIPEYNRRLESNTFGYTNKTSIDYRCYNCAIDFEGENRFVSVPCNTCNSVVSIDRVFIGHGQLYRVGDHPYGRDYACFKAGEQMTCDTFKENEEKYYAEAAEEAESSVKKNTPVLENKPSTTDKRTLRRKFDDNYQLPGIPRNLGTVKIPRERLKNKYFATIQQRECTKGVIKYGFKLSVKIPGSPSLVLLKELSTKPDFCGDGCGCLDTSDSAVRKAVEAAFEYDYKL